MRDNTTTVVSIKPHYVLVYKGSSTHTWKEHQKIDHSQHNIIYNKDNDICSNKYSHHGRETVIVQWYYNITINMKNEREYFER